MRELLSGHSRCLLLLSAWLAFGCGAAGVRVEARQQPTQTRASSEEPLTNAGVVKLVRAKFSEKIIVAVIRSRPARFDLSPDRLVELKRAGVPERVILAMLARDGATLIARQDADDNFAGDPFFDNFGGGTAGNARPGQSDPNEVNIFGSSGGARGRTRTNGLGGGAEGETQTTGSASVRIIRPPAEAGGAPPKLERTPTLTNGSVVEMVNAGFSEGTIIRRIEQSPADFDLSPAKLDELRRRRVTDPVIEAMRAAMSDGEQQTPDARHRP
ncbi:MAG TPA: hypothetical protein VK421_02625 [Pyrinomonadaceae bacterium]|nr:hypothetical protein [Pyrinomonadaceae bacterium]